MRDFMEIYCQEQEQKERREENIAILLLFITAPLIVIWAAVSWIHTRVSCP